MSLLIIYTTFPSSAEAETIAKALVESRLVACANIMAPHKAFYWWDGKVQNGTETAVIFKTRAELFEKAKEKILELHSYDTPCIVAWPIEKGHEAFLQWIEAETKVS